MARDMQMRLVYAWEKLAYPGYWDGTLGAPDIRALVRRVHADVRAAGGFAHEAPVVKFTKRNGSACASWGILKFSNRLYSKALVLHEIAHSLTWSYQTLSLAMRTTFGGDPLLEHARARFCSQGHGPRYVACFIALCERYAGFSAANAVELARGFTYQGVSPWRIVKQPANGGPARYMKIREPMMKHGRVAVDMAALDYWRALLSV